MNFKIKENTGREFENLELKIKKYMKFMFTTKIRYKK